VGLVEQRYDRIAAVVAFDPHKPMGFEFRKCQGLLMSRNPTLQTGL